MASCFRNLFIVMSSNSICNHMKLVSCFVVDFVPHSSDYRLNWTVFSLIWMLDVIITPVACYSGGFLLGSVSHET